MKQPFTLLVVVVILVHTAPDAVAGKKLVDLLAGLYGGDGILLATAPTASHTAHFFINSAASINRLQEQITTEIGQFPFNSSVGGFTFAFDKDLGTFVSADPTRTLGPLFAETSPTLGRGKLNVGLSYTFFTYDTFEGERLDRLQVTAVHDPDIIGLPDVAEQFEHDTVRIDLDLNLRVKILAVSATYGLTERLDIGLLLPIVDVEMDVRSVARVVQSRENTFFPGVHTFAGGPESPIDQASGHATGIGDLVLRGKYHFLNSQAVDLAGALLVKFATGDADNFLGTGDTSMRPFLIVSRTFPGVWRSPIHVTPHLNLGYEFNLERGHQDALEYVLGFDAGTQTLTIAGEFLGSHELAGDGIGDTQLTASVGIKWHPWKQLLLLANSQFPLNDDGLRAKLILTFGIEYSF